MVTFGMVISKKRNFVSPKHRVDYEVRLSECGTRNLDSYFEDAYKNAASFYTYKYIGNAVMPQEEDISIEDICNSSHIAVPNLPDFPANCKAISSNRDKKSDPPFNSIDKKASKIFEYSLKLSCDTDWYSIDTLEKLVDEDENFLGNLLSIAKSLNDKDTKIVIFRISDDIIFEGV